MVHEDHVEQEVHSLWQLEHNKLQKLTRKNYDMICLSLKEEKEKKE